MIKDGHEAKFNVAPEMKLIFNQGFKRHELSMIESIIEENTNVIVDRWKTYFKNS